MENPNANKKLKKFLIDLEITHKSVAEKINMPPATFSRKVNGVSEFTNGELKAIKEALSMTDEQFNYIFF